jgi:CRP-like cAMP-binding protein
MAKSQESIDCTTCSARYGSVFCNLNADNLEILSENKSCGMYKKGAVVFNEGQNPYGLYCVNKGKVKVFQTGNEGKEQIVRLAKEGDILGYRALLSGDRYSCSAEVLEESSVCFIPKEVFFQLIDAEGPLSLEIMKLLSKDLRQAEHKITDLAQKPVRERMAEALLFLKETYGYENDGLTLNVVLSREDIANIVGTATETAIRLLSEFKAEGIVAQNGKKIQINNIKRLVQVANIMD